MGKLMHNTQIKHSSHPHLLQLSPNFHLVPNQQQASCAGCNLQISAPDDMIYTCRPCNFFLHPSCSKFPQAITHPSHHAHPLSLLPTPIYPGGFFRCDACTHQGIRFSYHCHYCDFDLHVLCASQPLSVNHSFHPHPLVLTFSSPYGEKLGFSCDVCHTAGSSDQWLYRCNSCEFDVHLHCATSKTQPSLQHHNSFPGAAHGTQSNQQFVVADQPLSHSMSTGHVQTYYQPQNLASTSGFQTYQQQPIQQQPPIAVQTYQQQQPIQQQPAIGVQAYQQQQQPIQQQPPIGVQTYQMQQQPIQQQQMQQPQGQNVGPAGNGSLGEVMVTGFVDGMMQQLGQNFVQSLTGGGGGGGGGGGDGGGGGVGGGGGGCGNDGGNNDYGGNNECESTTSYDDY